MPFDAGQLLIESSPVFQLLGVSSVDSPGEKQHSGVPIILFSKQIQKLFRHF